MRKSEAGCAWREASPLPLRNDHQQLADAHTHRFSVSLRDTWNRRFAADQRLPNPHCRLDAGPTFAEIRAASWLLSKPTMRQQGAAAQRRQASLQLSMK